MLVLTLVAMGGIWLYDSVTRPKVVLVETVTLSRQTVEETVICTGTVTASEGLDVYAPVPCVAGDIAVKVGDRVEKGDVLLTVDRAATLAMAVDVGLSPSQSVMASAALPQTVTAPDSGVVSAVCAMSGATLTTDSPCVILSGGDGVSVAIAVREQALPRIAVGQAVAISGVAFDKDIYRGEICDIASSARSQMNGTVGETVVDVTVAFCEGEADESLLIGLTAKAAVTVATREDVLVVPHECITEDDEGNTAVYRVTDGVARRVAVTVVKSVPEGVLVEQGLEAGDVLVSSPTHLQGDTAAVVTQEDL